MQIVVISLFFVRIQRKKENQNFEKKIFLLCEQK